MADQSVLRSLAGAGDKLTKSRKVNHWIYFSKEEEMNLCKNELINANFTIESAAKSKLSSLPFELQIWRIDHVNIDSIYPITSKLRIIAKKYGGEYDGWETSVETE